MNSNSCHHCGDEIIGKSVDFDNKHFCCNGCKTVYQLLSESDLSQFYTLEKQAGKRPKNINSSKFLFLDIEEIQKKFIDFEDENNIHTTLFLPEIHCTSCIYLLENIDKIIPEVKSCQVNFTKREANIIFNKSLKFSELALTLAKIGYEPNFGNKSEVNKKSTHQFLYKLGIAGFAFGSIMLWTFPEYMGIKETNPEIQRFSAFLSFLVSIPVVLFSARDYFISAFKAIRYKSINLDVPISIGITALYLKSCYEVFFHGSTGYMDSFAGFIFFLLIGKWFQGKTYQSLSFDRDYTSYFPVAVTKKDKNNQEQIIEIDQLNPGDVIIIKNQEIIPCDAILQSKEAQIDYSFVSGESLPVAKEKGALIYAGGKLIGKQSEFIVHRKSRRSHLIQLWDKSSSSKNETKQKEEKISAIFLKGLLFTAALSALAWYFINPYRIIEIVVAVLIVACPCALALSRPFSYGSIMRKLGHNGLYLKNINVIDQLNQTTDIVFDKTGTLTTGSSEDVHFKGHKLSEKEKEFILLATNSSTHPLSRSIVKFLKNDGVVTNKEIDDFQEIEGSGIICIIEGNTLKIGKASFVRIQQNFDRNEINTHISINGEYLGRFVFQSKFRPGVIDLLNRLTNLYKIHILSGDKDTDKTILQQKVPKLKELHFRQNPIDKLNYIKKLKSNNAKITMVGDGLNDAGALDEAHTGIAVSEDIFRFSPKSDAILDANKIYNLDRLLSISSFTSVIMKSCYTFSILYNFIGLSFAITGNLSPLIAAILMPISSITIVLISNLMARLS